MQPRAEQIRFRSSKTGNVLLDAYLEAAERGNRTLADLLSDLFDDAGAFRSNIFQFRESPTQAGILQFRVGDFANPSAGWSNLSSTDFQAFVSSCQTSATNAANSATAASGSASAAAGSATNASNSASAASASASAASTSEINAAGSASAASVSATNAHASQTNAAESESAASSSADSALNSANAAASSKTAASTSETNAHNSASAASSSASAASTSATNAHNSATAAASSATSAQVAEIKWIGAWATATAYKASSPREAVSNGGSSYVCKQSHTSSAATQPGIGGSWTTYWDLMAQKGAKGDKGDKGDRGHGTGDLLASNNLSDLANAATARQNLGVKIGVNVQAYSSILAGTQQSFTTAQKNTLTTLKSKLDDGTLTNHRNLIINGNFDVWQRGTSLSNVSNGNYTADRWRYLHNGSGATATVSRQNHTLGQTVVPGNPRYYLRFRQTAAGSGATENHLTQSIEGVETLAGRNVTVTFYARANSSTQLTPFLQQHFGTGGSPSSPVLSGGSAMSLTTSWQRFTKVIALPSISGKLLGTDGNDHLGLIFQLPVNVTQTIDLSRVSLVDGDASGEYDPFSPRHVAQELELCQRYCWRGLPLRAFNFSAHAASVFVTMPINWPVPARTDTPTVSADLTGSSYNLASFHSFNSPTRYGARALFTSTAPATNCSILFGSASHFEMEDEL